MLFPTPSDDAGRIMDVWTPLGFLDCEIETARYGFWCIGGKAEEFVPFKESMNDSANRARPDLSRSQVSDRNH